MPARPPQARLLRDAARMGGHIAAWRKLQGLTADQVAARAGITRGTLRKVEAGELGVSLGSYLNVLRALGQLDRVIEATDPYETDLGRARADETLPLRVRSARR